MIEFGRTGEVIREMDKLANEDHTHHATEEELNVYRNNWWIRSNFVGSDTMPTRHRPDFKEALSTLRQTLNTDNETIRERIEEDMYFKIPGVPHSTVKQLHGASVRDLIQKIENHPNRHALQRDLQQSQSFNPFSQESKQMIHEVGERRIVCTTRYGTQSTV